MEWTNLTFGICEGKTIPEVIFTDPVWFFYALENNVFVTARATESLGREKDIANRMARSIKIPKAGDDSAQIAEYVTGDKETFFDFYATAETGQKPDKGKLLDDVFKKAKSPQKQITPDPGYELFLTHFADYINTSSPEYPSLIKFFGSDIQIIRKDIIDLTMPIVRYGESRFPIVKSNQRYKYFLRSLKYYLFGKENPDDASEKYNEFFVEEDNFMLGEYLKERTSNH